jgi:hypothetical protein
MQTTLSTLTEIRDVIQNTDDESERLAALAALREYVVENPGDRDALETLDKYQVLNQDYTKTLKTPAV